MQICGIRILNQTAPVAVADQPSGQQNESVTLVDPFADEKIKLNSNPSVSGLPARLIIIVTQNGGNPREGFITDKGKFDAVFFEKTGSGVNFNRRNTFNLSEILPVALGEKVSKYRSGVVDIARIVGMKIPGETDTPVQT